MILPSSEVAWVRYADGRVAHFDVKRLASSIMRAALRVGHDDPLLAESVALALEEFVLQHADGRTITAVALADLVNGVLIALGYPQIAAAYDRACRHAEVRLDEISDTVCELEFFRRLDEALQQIRADLELASVRVRGLRSCVKRLRQARYWSAGCRALAEEILFHVRERLIRSRRSRAAAFQLLITS